MLGRGFVGSGQGCEGSVAATRGGRLKDPEECHAGSFCSESLINMPKTVGCAAAKQAAKISDFFRQHRRHGIPNLFLSDSP